MTAPRDALERALEIAQWHVNHTLTHARMTSADDMGTGVKEAERQQKIVDDAKGVAAALAEGRPHVNPPSEEWWQPHGWPYVAIRWDQQAGVYLSRLGDPALLYSQAETPDRAIRALWSAAYLYVKTSREASSVAPDAHPGAPLPVLLFCPQCGAKHIDEGVWATKPHRKHMCAVCGTIWLAAEMPTVGVAEIPSAPSAPPEEKA